MHPVVKYLNGKPDTVKAAEYRGEGDWLNFYDEAGKAVGTIRADKVLSIPRADDKPILAR
jgi:hypothetical protein